MIRRSLRLCLAAGLLTSPAAGWAGFESGEVLRGLCRHNPALCLAYLEGVVDGAEALEWERVVTGLCIPQQVDSAALRTLFLDYAERHESLLQMPAGLLVIDALKQAWPCRPETR